MQVIDMPAKNLRIGDVFFIVDTDEALNDLPLTFSAEKQFLRIVMDVKVGEDQKKERCKCLMWMSYISNPKQVAKIHREMQESEEGDDVGIYAKYELDKEVVNTKEFEPYPLFDDKMKERRVAKLCNIFDILEDGIFSEGSELLCERIKED